jgi:hypothetical protein
MFFGGPSVKTHRISLVALFQQQDELRSSRCAFKDELQCECLKRANA